MVYSRAFVAACTNGRLKEAQQELLRCPAHDGNKAFGSVCSRGHLELAQWLWFLGGVDVHVGHDFPFRSACWQNHLEVGVDVHACNDDAFVITCERGHLKVAQWVWSLGGVDVHVKHDFSFRSACWQNHLEVAQ
jgi:hypothetical protein